MFCHKDYLDFAGAGRGRRISTTSPACKRIVDKWTSLYAATSEKHDAAAFAALPADKQVSARGIEVGHIFYFGTKYSEPMKAVVDRPRRRRAAGAHGLLRHRSDAAGRRRSSRRPMTRPASSGRRRSRRSRSRSSTSSRAMATTDAACEKLYRELTAKGVDVLYDDLDERPGAKFATADLIGMPWQVLVGPQGARRGQGRAQAARRRSARAVEPGGRGRPADAHESVRCVCRLRVTDGVA